MFLVSALALGWGTLEPKHAVTHYASMENPKSGVIGNVSRVGREGSTHRSNIRPGGTGGGMAGWVRPFPEREPRAFWPVIKEEDR
jgi:hypothetical protein